MVSLFLSYLTVQFSTFFSILKKYLPLSKCWPLFFPFEVQQQNQHKFFPLYNFTTCLNADLSHLSIHFFFFWLHIWIRTFTFSLKEALHSSFFFLVQLNCLYHYSYALHHYSYTSYHYSYKLLRNQRFPERMIL